eukprot:6188261-Pleurochrysis_carterae.AAC.3
MHACKYMVHCAGCHAERKSPSRASQRAKRKRSKAAKRRTEERKQESGNGRNKWKPGTRWRGRAKKKKLRFYEKTCTDSQKREMLTRRPNHTRCRNLRVVNADDLDDAAGRRAHDGAVERLGV